MTLTINKKTYEAGEIAAYIEELEKENADLKKSLAISEHDREHNDYELAEVYKKVKELEKENKELREKVHFWKKEVRVTERARNDEFDKIIIENRALKNQLSKLKEE